jgi:hypothetical protein
VRHILLCLPLCLLLQDQPPTRTEASGAIYEPPPPPTTQEKRRQQISRDVAGTLAALADPGNFACSVASLTFPTHSACPNLESPRPDLQQLGFHLTEDIFRNDPAKFLQMCLDHYKKTVTGYTCKFYKQERIGSLLNKLEVIDVHFQEKPFSVHFHWLKGGRLASKVLYVEGKNSVTKGELLARPFITFMPIIPSDVEGKDAKSTSRYAMTAFGMYHGSVRTLDGWLKAKAVNSLHIVYHGKKKVVQLGDRECYVFVRKPIDPPEEGDDKLAELTIYVDVQNWLQVGSILRDGKGDLIAEYFFRDVKLNPTFSPKQFTRDSL